MQYHITPPPMNPLSRLLAGILAVIAVAGAFFFGFIVLILALAAGLVGWLFLWFRMWRIRRKMPQSDVKSGNIIDAEYTVVSRRDEE